MAARAITIANAKGGVGKTFLAIHLAYMLAEDGAKTLIIDTDPQGSVGEWLGLESPVTLSHFMLGQASFDEAIVSYKNKLDVIPSSESIKAAELQLVGLTGRELVLNTRLEDNGVYDRYDYIIIDTSPSLSLLNQNAYLASNEVLIPIAMEPLAVIGSTSITENIKIIRKIMKHKLSLLGVVPTMVTKTSKIATQVLKLINGTYDSVMPGIRQSVKIKESSGQRMTLNEYDPKNPVMEDLKSLMEKVKDGKAA